MISGILLTAASGKGRVIMEILVGAVIIIIILLLLGVDMWYFLVGGAALVALAAAFVAVFFSVCAVMLLRSKKCTGQFSKFIEGKRFEAAVYQIDEREYRCAFPAEFVMRDRIYKPGRPVKLRLTRGGRVFDRNAFLTVLVGLPVSIIAAFAFGGGMGMLLGWI